MNPYINNYINIKFNEESLSDEIEVRNVNFKNVQEYVVKLKELFISHSTLKSLILIDCTNKALVLDSIKDLPLESLIILDEKVKENINIGIMSLKKLQISMIEGTITLSEGFKNLKEVYLESPSDINNIEYLETSSGMILLYITVKYKVSGILSINNFPKLKSLTLENVSVKGQEVADLPELHQLIITDGNIKRIRNHSATLTTLKVTDECLEEIDINGENLDFIYIKSNQLKKINIEEMNQENLIMSIERNYKRISPEGTAHK